LVVLMKGCLSSLSRRTLLRAVPEPARTVRYVRYRAQGARLQANVDQAVYIGLRLEGDGQPPVDRPVY
jgi:hypothetical protein